MLVQPGSSRLQATTVATNRFHLIRLASRSRLQSLRANGQCRSRLGRDEERLLAAIHDRGVEREAGCGALAANAWRLQRSSSLGLLVLEHAIQRLAEHLGDL